MQHKDLTAQLFANINSYSSSNDTTSKIKDLITSGADLTATDSDGFTPMRVGERVGHWPCVEVIAGLKKTDNKDNAAYGNGVLWAVKAGKIDIVKLLLKQGASTTWQTTNDENRSLHWAVKNKNLQMIELLLDYN